MQQFLRMESLFSWLAILISQRIRATHFSMLIFTFAPYYFTRDHFIDGY